MNKSLQIILVCGLGMACCCLGGCSSNANNIGPGSDFERSIKAPKGPMPPEARKAMEAEMAKQKALNEQRKAGQPATP